MGRALRSYVTELVAHILLSGIAITLVAGAAVGAYLVIVLQAS